MMRNIWFIVMLLVANFNCFAVSLAIESSAFATRTVIPNEYTCNGSDVSPPLQWFDATGHAISYVIIVEDPDAPDGNWVHWVLFNIPNAVTYLAKRASLPVGAISGKNSWGTIGYRGPCPKTGTHHYYFKVWALDTMLDLDETATRDDVMKAMEGHMVANNQLIGLYPK